VALRFAKEGATVVAADASESGVAQTVELIHKAGGQGSYARLDVSDPEDVNRVVQRTVEEFGDLQILFNGAGILLYGTVLETSQEAWNRVMAVNLTGTFLCAQGCLHTWLRKVAGRSSMWLPPPVLMTPARMPPRTSVPRAESHC
jgi:NAD(P)-dependent dehydrogenase (short-subunit alcohol dehydrogenase family)